MTICPPTLSRSPSSRNRSSTFTGSPVVIERLAAIPRSAEAAPSRWVAAVASGSGWFGSAPNSCSSRLGSAPPCPPALMFRAPRIPSGASQRFVTSSRVPFHVVDERTPVRTGGELPI